MCRWPPKTSVLLRFDIKVNAFPVMPVLHRLGAQRCRSCWKAKLAAVQTPARPQHELPCSVHPRVSDAGRSVLLFANAVGTAGKASEDSSPPVLCEGITVQELCLQKYQSDI